ncbi:MAG TPA: EAL domain-containing protein [Devosiaceae bacterium]|nr:EAL domain-containing protein [Devosiaceae bacterium]
MRALPLVVATIVVAIGSYFVGLSTIRDLQASRAEFSAKSFAKYLVQQVPDLSGIVEGAVTTGSPIDALETIRPVGSVFKFRLYDLDGNLRVDSSPFAASHVVNSRDAFQDLAAQAVAHDGAVRFDLHRGDGRFLPVYYSEVLVPFRADNRLIGVLSVLSDESETLPDLFAHFRSIATQVVILILIAFGVPVILYVRKLMQLELARRRLRHSSQHDELTGALNRMGFMRLLTEQIEAGNRRHLSTAVHIIDLDRFKDVNEAGGHQLGDWVLRETVDRIHRVIGARERVARLGADEFAILKPFHPAAPQAVAELGKDIAEALSEPFTHDGRVMQIGASVGYATAPADGFTPDELMRAADVALHHAKLHARGRAVQFNPSMEAERQSRHRIEHCLRQALAEDGFNLQFQPVFETRSGRLRGFEALLRLNDEFGVPISPAEFIPVAEDVGLIDDIGMWVLREACRIAAQWPQDLFVAVNLSPAQFVLGDMAGRVRDALQRSGLRAERLELEVTESLLITDTENVLRELKAIKALGPTLALDDFGTGYSSLGYLWRFPFDKLKVDRSFMSDLTVAGSRSREILSTIIALGRVLNLRITAEGVETEAQAAVLRELDCDLVQGYLFGRPQDTRDVGATILRAFGGRGQGATVSPLAPQRALAGKRST